MNVRTKHTYAFMFSGRGWMSGGSSTWIKRHMSVEERDLVCYSLVGVRVDWETGSAEREMRRRNGILLDPSKD